MSLLVIGVIIFSLTHLLPSALPDARNRVVARLGENRYRGLFALVIVAALVLVVFGWKRAVPTAVYAPPLSASPVTSALILIGFVLFIASQVPGNIKRYIRHPQMIGTLCWAAAHLLLNGDSRSVTLFGGLSAWAVLEILLINRREGAWQKPGPAAMRLDITTVVVGLVAFAAMVYFHSALFGVAAVPGV